MAAASALDTLLARGDLWRGVRPPPWQSGVLTTGHPPLDRLLGGGWPRGALVEIGIAPGHGEWRLASPALRAAAAVVLLDPPALPFAPALAAELDLDRLILVRTGSRAEFLDAFRELAAARDCAALLAWTPAGDLDYPTLRQCQLAAGATAALRLLFRPPAAARRPSPAPLRLAARCAVDGLEVWLLRRRGFAVPPRPPRVVLPREAGRRTSAAPLPVRRLAP
ncbi:MAG: hypothetical protein KatS3mg124_1237 [Porticoccaceae bacterium]|nr:MAG: hypothetical protein KatS3mg124_1237 [Porticoccaceae bacterium]